MPAASPTNTAHGDDPSVITKGAASRGCCSWCMASNIAGAEEPSRTPAAKSTAAPSGSVAATAAVPDLPPGWKAVQSRSRPDRMAFQNELTGERISWVPTEPASTVRGEIRRSKRKSGKTRVGHSGSVGSHESDVTKGSAAPAQ